jgi:hypothetical protein
VRANASLRTRDVDCDRSGRRRSGDRGHQWPRRPPVRIFPRRIERALHMTIDRPKRCDARELDWAALLGRARDQLRRCKDGRAIRADPPYRESQELSASRTRLKSDAQPIPEQIGGELVRQQFH